MPNIGSRSDICHTNRHSMLCTIYNVAVMLWLTNTEAKWLISAICILQALQAIVYTGVTCCACAVRFGSTLWMTYREAIVHHHHGASILAGCISL